MTMFALVAVRFIPLRLFYYAAILLFGVALTQLKRWTYGLAHHGKYDQALRLNSIFSKIPGYGHSLEGLILFSAGRYEEAERVLRPLAFDAQGHPRLSSQELYVYCLALINSGRTAEAQHFLEEAVLFAKEAGSLHVALATCLLTQEKTPDRARQLMEEVLAIPPRAFPSYEQRADRMLRIARYAWAEARCGRRADARVSLRAAAEGSTGFKDRDMAGMLYYMGEAWKAMAEFDKARTAWEESLSLFPYGSSALSAKKALASLNQSQLTVETPRLT